MTSFRDPGILPRHLDPAPERMPPDRGPFAIEAPYGEAKGISLFLERVDHGGDPAQGTSVHLVSKWCTTCRLYRPPRCSHCRSCDNCVDGLDHHCVFLNVCIGRRNYTTFYAMLCHMLALSLLGLVGCVLHLYYLAKPRDPHAARGFVHALKTSPASVAFFWLALVWLIPVACLWTYHSWLILRNRSTVEQIRLETTQQLYDMPATQSMALDEHACLRPLVRVSASVRSACTPADFATHPPAVAEEGARAQRRRTPFQYASFARNARAVLGRPTPAPYIVWPRRVPPS